jgi:hypothetical protein
VSGRIGEVTALAASLPRINLEFYSFNHQFCAAFDRFRLVCAASYKAPLGASKRIGVTMLSDHDVVRAATAMMNEFGEAAELQAAKYADLMLWQHNRAALMIWARIWRTIAEMRPARTGLPH